MIRKLLQQKIQKEIQSLSVEDFLRLKFGESKEDSQKRFISYLVKDLFNTIDENDILQEKPGGKVLFRGNPLSQEAVNLLRDNAETFASSTLWQILNNEVKYKANLRMFEKAKNEQDLIAGKMALWILEVINKKLIELSKKRVAGT